MAHRKNILKLATKISLESLTYTGITYNDCEYRILDPIVTDEMCEVCMHMKLNTPRSLPEIAKRTGKSEADTKKQLEALRKAGIIRTRDMDGITGYYYPIWVPGIMEGILSNREQCDAHPDLGACFEEYTRKRLAILVPNLEHGMSFMRVIPVEAAIKNNSRAASYDEISTLIENATAISVGPCSCRRSRRLMGEGCGHLEEDMCMYLNDNAVNFSQLGTHRLVSKEEAYEILKRAEDNGLIHEINQTDGFEEVTAICNCCSCSCYALRIAAYFRTPDGIRSNYVARVDKDKCVACGQCVESCQLNAVKLGKKLCSVTPEAEAAPDARPAEKFWGEADYNADYRTDRTDTADSGTAPCKAECPAHVPVQGYIKLASQGKYREALELIRHYTPFPAVCGRICNRRCEDACTRGGIDDPVAIDEIKKFIAEQELREETRFVPRMLNQTGRPFSNKIAVVGAGPAGLSCAYYLALKGYPVTVFEKERVPGGMLTLGIPGFRLEKDVVNAEIDILKEMGVEFRTGVEVGRDVTLNALRRQGFEAFCLAVGASKGTAAGCPGDELPGVFTGIDFLRAVNLGEHPVIGKRVAVIGGGNVAVDVARAAVRLGAEATVIYRRTRAEMPADEQELAEAEAEGVRFLFLRAPAEIGGADRVERLKLEHMRLGVADAKGRRTPAGIGEFETLDVDGVISATGQRVDLGEMEKDGGLTLRRDGTVIADPRTCQTAQPDIFAVGDAVTGPAFVIDAIAAGREAAVSIHRFVHEGQTLHLGREPWDYRAFDRRNVAVNIAGFDNTPRQRPAEAGGRAAFADPRGTFTEEEMLRETRRCLGCGAAVVNENMCVGCGICTTKCKFDAISLAKVHDNNGTPYFRTLGRVLGLGAKRYGRLAVKKVTRAGGKA